MSVLADAQTGILLTLRGVSLIPAFSDALDGLVAAQWAPCPTSPWSRMMPSCGPAMRVGPNAMVSDAIEHGGQPFQAGP